MDQRDLYEEWERNKDRPQWVRNHQDNLKDYLTDGVVESMPAPDASAFEWRQFLNSHMGSVTRQLNPETGDSDNTEDAETGDNT